MKKIIAYHTAYADPPYVIGYVIAKDAGACYIISERAYKNALKRRTIGGDAGIIFRADKPVRIRDRYGIIR